MTKIHLKKNDSALIFSSDRDDHVAITIVQGDDKVLNNIVVDIATFYKELIEPDYKEEKKR